MKKIKVLFGIILAALAISCEGPAGPPGPPGFDGRDGANGMDGQDAVFGTVLEIEGSFSPTNNYSIFYEFPQTVEVFESDAVLVYLLWDQAENPDGGDPIDIWRLLPQTRILDQGLLQYNYDHTFLDVTIFLESDFDLGTLLPGDTDNQIFRIAVVPASFGTDASIDLTNLDSVMDAMKFDVSSMEKIQLD